MPLITDVRVGSHAAQATRSRGMLRPTGWEVLGGSNTGVSLGDVAKVGLGVASFEVRKLGMPFSYKVTGGYEEFGAGLGLEVKAALFGAAAARLWKIVGSVSTDMGGLPQDISLPSGSLSQFYFGPTCGQPSLGHADFEGSTWLYLNIAGTMGGIAGDIGLLALIDPAVFADAFRSAPNRQVRGLELEGALFASCIAWCVYAGSGLAIGVGVGGGIRLIRTLTFTVKLLK